MKKDQETLASTRARLAAYSCAYPASQPQDVFKYLYQSAFGCEHLVTEGEGVLLRIAEEYATLGQDASPTCLRLDGAYSRVSLGWLKAGLSPKTLASLFCLSAKKEENGEKELKEKLAVAREMAERGEFSFSFSDFSAALQAWEAEGMPALHHSAEFRAAYRPAYRVLSCRYANLLPLFATLDRLLARPCPRVVLAIEGGSAAGKSTLAAILKEVYDAAVFHTDDFFLRPEQRTPARMAEVGGNLDRERFAKEVLLPLGRGETVIFRPYDCTRAALGAPVAVPPKPLSVVEGAYSMHPAFGEYYDAAVFLDVAPDLQKARIAQRNSPALAARFFAEWIPMENSYFAGMRIKERASLCLTVGEED